MVRKVMFICAHNQTRSVAGEALLQGEEGFRVRSRAAWRGTSRKVRPSDGVWADEVYVMMPGMAVPVIEAGVPKEKIRSLWIPDNFMTCEDELLRTLKRQLAQYDIHIKKSLQQAKEDCWAVTEKKMGYGKGFLWEWTPPTEEEMRAEKQPPPAGVPVERLGEYPYVPLWHMEEGERRKREEPSLWEAEIPREEKMRMYEEAEAYIRQQERERAEEERRMAEKFGAGKKAKAQRKVMGELKKYTESIKKLFET